MGYVREPKNVDLVVGPSVLTEATKRDIAQAIAQYHKTGKKPISVDFVSQGSVKTKTHLGRVKSSAGGKVTSAVRKKAKI